MVELDEIKQILAEVLQIGERVNHFDAQTTLLGGLPEFDSMAVVMVITALEENYGITIEDDEVSADVFETIGSLQQFVVAKASNV